MYTFLDQCPNCLREAVRVEFTYQEDGGVTHAGRQWRSRTAVDIVCCTCNKRLDDDEDAVAACINAAEEELEDARYSDL